MVGDARGVVDGLRRGGVGTGERTHRILCARSFPNIVQYVATDFGPLFLGADHSPRRRQLPSASALQPPTADWGLMIAENPGIISSNRWRRLAPGIMLGLITVGVNLVADGYSERWGDQGRGVRTGVHLRSGRGPAVELAGGVPIVDEVSFTARHPGRSSGWWASRARGRPPPRWPSSATPRPGVVIREARSASRGSRSHRGLARLARGLGVLRAAEPRHGAQPVDAVEATINDMVAAHRRAEATPVSRAAPC